MSTTNIFLIVIFTILEGSDFIADEDELQFDFSTNQACFAVGIVDDDNFEELLESFSISLTSTNPRVNITQGTLPVIIEDNEGNVKGSLL